MGYTRRQKIRIYNPLYANGRWNLRFKIGLWIGGFTAATRYTKAMKLEDDKS